MQKSVLALQDFLDQTSIVWNQQGDRPALNSQAAIELANFSRPESIVTTYSQALLLFETAVDYSTALIKTLTEPAQSVAPWSCARSVLETSALALWLWDTNIDARQRVQRSLAFRYEGLTQQLKFAQVSNNSLSKGLSKNNLVNSKYDNHVLKKFKSGQAQCGTKQSEECIIGNSESG